MRRSKSPRHLIPNDDVKHGLDDKEWSRSTDDGCSGLIRRYIREAGVRNLERELTTLARKAVKDYDVQEEDGQSDRRSRLREYPASPKFRYGEARERRPGRNRHRTGIERSRRRAAHHRSVMMPGKGR